MTNGQIYRKTLTFSVGRLIFDILSVLIVAAAALAGLFLAGKGLPGLLIGLIVGIILAYILFRLFSYKYKAAQIAMMTRGVVDGSLPDNVKAEGYRVVKERFVTVAIYFAVTRAIKGVFQQLGRLITGVAGSLGGSTGRSVGDVVNSGVQTLIGYLCDCCLGWIFLRETENAFSAACEGAVLFFRHGKTLLKNMGRIFGMGIASFIIIGGVFTGIFYLFFSQFPQWFVALSGELAGVNIENAQVAAVASDPKLLIIACAVIAAIVLWSILHSVLVRPFVLVGVLRNYINSGINDIPSPESFNELASKSRKFAAMQKKAAGTT